VVAVHVAWKVQPKRASSRGRARVLERIEREGLAGAKVLQVPFDDDDAFHRRV
jgi:hypothetical protein